MEVALDLFSVAVEGKCGDNGKMLKEDKFWVNRNQLHKHNMEFYNIILCLGPFWKSDQACELFSEKCF